MRIESPRSDGRAPSWSSGLLAVALGLIAIPTAAVSGAPSALTSTDTHHTTSAPPKPTPPAGTPAPKLDAPLAAPADVTVDAADRRLTVSWSPVAGATNYKVAVRLVNGVEPFAWRVYDTPSPPYAVMDRWAAMSGLEYEIRVAAVNGDGQAIWSPSVAITAPPLRPAPADTIEAFPAGPYGLGDVMVVSLSSQRPFTRKSPWVWSVCDPDGSGCKLVPITYPSVAYRVGEEAHGKSVRVQVDYDKYGWSWTATAVLGIVGREIPPRQIFPSPVFPPGCEEAAPSSVADAFTRGARLDTHLHRLDSKSVRVSCTTQPAARSSLFAMTCSS